MAEPQQGAAECWETPPPRLPRWGSFRPSLEPFLPAPFLGFHLLTPSARPTHLTHCQASPSLAFSASPHPSLPYALSLLFHLSSFSHHPFSVQTLSTQLHVPLLCPHHPHPPPPRPLPQPSPPSSPFLSKTVPIALSPTPQPFTPSMHAPIKTLRRQPLFSRVPLSSSRLHPSPLRASASRGSLRPPCPPGTPLPLFPPPRTSPQVGTLPFPVGPRQAGGRGRPPLPSAHSEVRSAALACVPAPSLPPQAGPRPLPAAARRP